MSITDLRDYSNIYAGIGRATIQVGQNPQSIIVVGDKIYVTNTGDNTLSVIDPLTNSMIKSIDLAEQPRMILFRAPFIFSINENTVSVIDAKEIKILKNITV